MRWAMLFDVKRPIGWSWLALACFPAVALAQSPTKSARLPSLPAAPTAGNGAESATNAWTGEEPTRVDQADDPASLSAAGAAALTPQQLYAHVMRGVVALERNGLPMAIGTVLSGDGRVLTALSALGGGEGADVLYADGTLVHAKLGRADRAADLALLVPQSLKWTEGLSASESRPMGEELRAMLPAPTAGKGVRLSPAVALVKGQVDAHARDGAALLRLLDVDLRGVPVVGAPLLDATGGVVGVLVRACKGPASAPPPAPEGGAGAWYPTAPPTPAPGPCKVTVLGAPVSAIRAFLSGSAAAEPVAPWLGIRGEPDGTGKVRGVRIVAVAPGSPAEKAGLKPEADVIVAVEGRPVDSPEKLADVIARHAAGEAVKLLVFTGDRFREIAVALRPAP